MAIEPTDKGFFSTKGTIYTDSLKSLGWTQPKKGLTAEDISALTEAAVIKTGGGALSSSSSASQKSAPYKPIPIGGSYQNEIMYGTKTEKKDQAAEEAEPENSTEEVSKEGPSKSSENSSYGKARASEARGIGGSFQNELMHGKGSKNSKENKG